MGEGIGYRPPQIEMRKPTDFVRYGDTGLEIEADQQKLREHILQKAHQEGIDAAEAQKLESTKVYFERDEYYRHIAEVFRQKAENSKLKKFSPILNPRLFAGALGLSNQFIVELGSIFSDPSGPAILMEPKPLHDFLQRHPEMTKPHAVLPETLARVWEESADLLVKLQDKKFRRNNFLKKSGKFLAYNALTTALSGGQALIWNNIPMAVLGYPVRTRIADTTLALADKGLNYLFKYKSEAAKPEVTETAKLFNVKYEKIPQAQNFTPLAPLSTLQVNK